MFQGYMLISRWWCYDYLQLPNNLLALMMLEDGNTCLLESQCRIVSHVSGVECVVFSFGENLRHITVGSSSLSSSWQDERVGESTLCPLFSLIIDLITYITYILVGTPIKNAESKIQDWRYFTRVFDAHRDPRIINTTPCLLLYHQPCPP